MTVNGILESALYVKDVGASAAFYQRVFGFAALLESERLIALRVPPGQVLLLFAEGATLEDLYVSGGKIPGHGCTGKDHFAFAIAAEDAEVWQQRLSELGVAVESTVAWSGGSFSIYFRDPDGHVVELMTPGFWERYG